MTGAVRTRDGKLGVIAGGGPLPVALADHMRAVGAPYHVIRLRDAADPLLADHPGDDAAVESLGAIMRALHDAGCDHVVLAGLLARPDFAALRPDWRGVQALPRVLAASRRGDDALLRAVAMEFEREGFQIVGAHEVITELRASAGVMGAVTPDADAMADIDKARHVVAAMGALDIGQGAVVCAGLVLAVEAQEGTDRMLERVATLPQDVRGSADARRGVLVKAPKPVQERRLDMPTIGVRTIELAARAGLAGVAAEAGGCLIMDRPATIAAADAAGLFLYGFTPEDSDDAGDAA